VKTKLLLFIPLALALCSFLTAHSAAARNYETATLHIAQPWARATAAGIADGAVYMTIRNKGRAPDSLLSATAEVAEKTELHETVMSQGMIEMRPVPEIKIAAGKTVKIHPGGLHIMLVNLKHPLKAGERFPMTLHFAHAGDVKVEVVISKAAAGEMKMGGHGTMNMAPQKKGADSK
jgi:periplasmic copper chaperone A